MIHQQQPHWQPGVNSCAPEGLAVSDPLKLLIKILNIDGLEQRQTTMKNFL